MGSFTIKKRDSSKKTFVRSLFFFLCLALALGCLFAEPDPPSPPRGNWFALHFPIYKKADADTLLEGIPALADQGVNALIVEINYRYEYVSHPELRSDDPVTRETVKKIVTACRKEKIRLIPQFQSLGHQSWEAVNGELLTRYPQFDETQGRFPGNKGIYCRSWCPLHPDVNRIIFALYDELLDAFEADALHVGLDEVFIIASNFCPRCRGQDPALIFARAVNDYYRHIVKKRGKGMLMWGDRLLDARSFEYGDWEASANGTHPASSLIPKDIILCDWHYERLAEYPSIALFLKKGFRVLPTSYDDPEAVASLIAYSRTLDDPRMLGHLCTLWNGATVGFPGSAPQLKAAAQALFPAAEQKP